MVKVSALVAEHLGIVVAIHLNSRIPAESWSVAKFGVTQPVSSQHFAGLIGRTASSQPVATVAMHLSLGVSFRLRPLAFGFIGALDGGKMQAAARPAAQGADAVRGRMG